MAVFRSNDVHSFPTVKSRKIIKLRCSGRNQDGKKTKLLHSKISATQKAQSTKDSISDEFKYTF